MTKTISNITFRSLSLLTILLFSLVVTGNSQGFSRNLRQTTLGLKKEKLSHLHFYFHDILGGPNPTAVQVVEGPTSNTSATGFGFVVMFDNPLTVGPELSSKLVGRAQGLYASADMNEIGLLMVLNYAFVEGKYNGSTLSILGRNSVMSSSDREMPIVGGSGVFRFARGYAKAKTYSVNMTVAVVEYNVYVLHY